MSRRRANINETYVRGPTRSQLKKQKEEKGEIEEEKPQVPFRCSNGKSYSVSYARTDRLKCHKCKNSIASGSFILGLNSNKTISRIYHEDAPRWSKSVPWTFWVHPECFVMIKSMQREFQGPENFLGYDALNPEDQLRCVELAPFLLERLEELFNLLVSFFHEIGIVRLVLGYFQRGAETMEASANRVIVPSELTVRELKEELQNRGYTDVKVKIKAELVELLETMLANPILEAPASPECSDIDEVDSKKRKRRGEKKKKASTKKAGSAKKAKKPKKETKTKKRTSKKTK